MAVVKAPEIAQKSGSINADGHRDRIRVYRVTTNNPADDDDLVAGAVPQIGTSHPSDPFCWVTKIDPRQEKQIAGGTQWLVTVSYSSRPRTNCNQATVDPRLMKPTVEWVWEKKQEIVHKCRKVIGGAPSVELFSPMNSASQPFRDPILRDVTVLNIRVIANRPTYDSELAESMHDKLNATSFIIWGRVVKAQHAKLQFWRGVPQFVGNCEVFYRHEIEIAVRSIGPDGTLPWDRDIMDQGTAYLVDDGDGGKVLRNVKDDAGSHLNEEVPLDGNGERLAVPLTDANPAVFLTYRPYETTNFAPLDLPKNAP